MAKQLERLWTCNLEALNSSPALTAGWICSLYSRVQILGHACKYPAGLPQASWNS